MMPLHKVSSHAPGDWKLDQKPGFWLPQVMRRSLLLALGLMVPGLTLGQDNSPAALPGTTAIQENMPGADRSTAMVAGIDRFVMREIAESVKKREVFWHRDFSSPQAYDKSVAPNRKHLRHILGVREEDQRVPIPALEYLATTQHDSKVGEADTYTIHAVRWPVLNGVNGEGLYFKLRGKVQARVVLLPDADQEPELLAGLVRGQETMGRLAHELAQAGCEVVIPVLASRGNEFSCSTTPGIQPPVRTNQTHREWLYRQAFEMGRHVIGYELQKVFALLDWMSAQDKAPVAVAGYGEGGCLALFASALDTRVNATLISGAFENRNHVWKQPIYRNVFGLLREFGDAELATLVLPRPLVIGYGVYPTVSDTPAKLPKGENSAAPGGLTRPDLGEVRAEVLRARNLMQNRLDKNLRLVVADEGDNSLFPAEAHGWFSKALNLTEHPGLAAYRTLEKSLPDAAARQERTVREMQRHTQTLLITSEDERNAKFWKSLPLDSLEKYQEATKPWRDTFWNEVIGKIPEAPQPLNPRTRLLSENEEFTLYEVLLDVWPEVEAWGYLLVPKGIKPGEKRPVVVCQHGLEGLPEDTVAEDEKHPAWHYYKGFASKLARQGFVTFAPHNFYRGKDAFRVIQRKLNPLGQTLFSVIVGQHERILEFLREQPFVDEKRIGFYGLSYGGKSAMRIPAALEGYSLSICSGDFNEWVRKNMEDAHKLSYLYHGEYEIFEWDLGSTFNYAEMAALIAPRPFMVERGHDDGVGIDEWVSWEYSKVRRLYDKLGVGERTEIEYFNGPHTINGKGTFEFLHHWLNWPMGKP